MRNLVFTVMLTFFAAGSIAQKRHPDNYLLWRVTGKDLRKPSYVFGTMHLTDRRLFHFGDSLYSALERSEGFAAELDMNNLMSDYLSQMMGSAEEDEYVKDLVSEEFASIVKSKLEKKIGKPFDEITEKDIDSEEQKRNMLALKSGEMNTFMDAYLFDIAEKQGKWTGGIEDASDQFGLKVHEDMEDRILDLFNTIEEDKNSLESMVKIYLSENLNLLDSLDELWRGSKDFILIKRNVKMSHRIDSLAKVRSGFFAIGAAHLPGDSGVVNLLRKRGYTLTPVLSSKKIKPEDYKYKKIARPWVSTSFLDSSFTVMMPSAPEDFKMVENSPIQMKVHFDMASYCGFFAMAIPNSIETNRPRDTIFARLTEHLKSNASKFSSKKISHRNLEGTEYEFTNESGEYRMQAFVDKEYVAINTVFALNRKNLYLPNAEQFLKSLMPGKKKVAEKATTKEWKRYELPDHLLSVSFPVKYKKKSLPDEVENNWTKHTYEAMDLRTNAYFGISVNEALQGYYATRDTTYFPTIRDNLVTAVGGRITLSEETTFLDYPAYKIQVEGIGDKDSMTMKVLLVNRGNRKFTFFYIYMTSDGDKDYGQFFSSIRLLPNDNSKWKKRSPSDNSFSVVAADTIQTLTDEETGEISYLVFDKQSSITAQVEKEKLSRFFWTKDFNKFFDDEIENRGVIGDADSLLSKKKVTLGKHNGIDLTIRVNEGDNIKRMLYLLNGDSVYSVFSYITNEAYREGLYEKFFESFRINNFTPTPDLTVSKKNQLLKALVSTDSAEFYEARNFIFSAPLESSDLKSLRPLLLKPLKDFDSLYYYSTNANAIIADILRTRDTVGNDLVEFIEKNYKGLKGKATAMRPFMLQLLKDRKTKESYTVLRDLLSNHPPDTALKFNFYLHTDSLGLTRILYPQALNVIGHPSLGATIGFAAIELIDSSLLTGADIAMNKEPILKSTRSLLSLPEEIQGEETILFENAAALLAAINDKESIDLLHRIANVEYVPIKFAGVMNVLKVDGVVAGKHLDTLAASDQFRYDLYQGLKDMNKTELFPSAYRTQEAMGKSFIYYLAYDEEPPSEVKHLGERLIDYEGKLQRFHFYSVSFDEEGEEKYLGVAGPFDPERKNFFGDMKLSFIHWDQIIVEEELEELKDMLINEITGNVD